MIVRIPKTDDTTMVPIKKFLLDSSPRRSRRECSDIVGGGVFSADGRSMRYQVMLKRDGDGMVSREIIT